MKQHIIRTIRANLTTSKSFRLNNIRQLVRDPHYDAKKPTVLYVHGWEENQRQPNVAVIPHSYDIRGGWNVILLDWDRIAVGNYTIVWYNSIQVSNSSNGSNANKLSTRTYKFNFLFQVVQAGWTNSPECIQQRLFEY